MRIRFWGTRGSLPQSLSNQDITSLFGAVAEQALARGMTSVSALVAALKGGEFGTISYGGDTTSVEITSREDDHVYIDMGSGIRGAGSLALKSERKEHHVFLTHMHWDHVMGMPYFLPVHSAGHTVHIHHVHRNAPEHVRINFNGVNFPLKWEQLAGKIEFHQQTLYESTKIGNLTVTPFALDHPGGSFGYRVEGNGKSLAFGVDGEYKRRTRQELGKDLPFFQNLDLLVFDSQYEINELASHYDWGHCSPNIGVDLALREKIRNLVFVHHDPWSTRSHLDRMFDDAKKHLEATYPEHKEVWESAGSGKATARGPNLFYGYDGLELDLLKL